MSGVRRFRRGRGQTVIETALVLFLFLFLSFAVVEGGFFVFSYVSLNHGAQEGGRLAILPGTANDTAVKSRVVTAAQPVSVNAANVTVLINNGAKTFGARTTGDRVKVTATYAYSPLIGSMFFGGTITMTGVTEVMVE